MRSAAPRVAPQHQPQVLAEVRLQAVRPVTLARLLPLRRFHDGGPGQVVERDVFPVAGAPEAASAEDTGHGSEGGDVLLVVPLVELGLEPGRDVHRVEQERAGVRGRQQVAGQDLVALEAHQALDPAGDTLGPRREVLVTGRAIGRASPQGAATSRAQIDGVLRQAVDAGEVPGVVAMAATDKGVLYEGAFGSRALGKGPAMTADTVFRIASMTKAVTSVAAMQLVEQGKLKLDNPVPGIDPAVGSPQVLDGFDAAGAPTLRPAKRPITLRHRLTHTAGCV